MNLRDLHVVIHHPESSLHALLTLHRLQQIPTSVTAKLLPLCFLVGQPKWEGDSELKAVAREYDLGLRGLKVDCPQVKVALRVVLQMHAQVVLAWPRYVRHLMRRLSHYVALEDLVPAGEGLVAEGIHELKRED